MLATLWTNPSLAQVPFVPRDLFGDEHRGSTVIRKNAGQVQDTQHRPRPDMEHVGEAPEEPLWTPHDAFIASFGIQSTVGIGTEQMSDGGTYALHIKPLSAAGQWLLTLPTDGLWNIAVVDATGREVLSTRTPQQSLVLDLQRHAPGIYVVRASLPNGLVLSTKLAKP